MPSSSFSAYMFQFDSKSVYQGEREQFLIDFSAGPKDGKGQIYLALDLPDNPGAEDSIAQRVWKAFQDTSFRCTTDDSFLCFEEALKAVNDILATEGRKREEGTIGRVNGVALVLSGNTLHFSQTGLSEIFLLRRGQLSRISEEASEEPQQTFLEIASGELMDDDRILLSTRSIEENQEELVEVGQTDPKKLSNRLKAFGKQSGMNGVLAVLLVEAVDAPHSYEQEADDDEDRVESLADEFNSGPPIKKHKRFSFSELTKRVDVRKLRHARDSASKVFHGIGDKVKGFAQRPSTVKGVNRRYVMLGIIFVVIVLGFFISAQSSIRQEQQLADNYQLLLKEVRNKISIAEQRFLIGEKTDALDFLNTASQEIQDIEQAGYFKNEVNQLKEEVASSRDVIDSNTRLSAPYVLADLGQKGPVDALGLIHTKDEKNYVYEPRRMFETILDKVQDPQTIDAEAVVIAGWDFEDNNSLVFVTQDGRVVEYREGRFEFMGTSDSAWKRGIDLKSYNRFVYLLDNNEGVIWKYPRLRTKYGNSIQYNAEGDLRDAVSFAIDGNVYVLKRDGTILKFNKGNLQEFTVKDQPRIPLQNPTRIFTHTEAQHLYVLDPSNSRVVVYSKGDGSVSRYQKQYLFESVNANELRDLFVDQNEQKLYVLSKDKIFLVDL